MTIFVSELQKSNDVREGQHLRCQTYFSVNSTFHYVSLIIHSCTMLRQVHARKHDCECKVFVIARPYVNSLWVVPSAVYLGNTIWKSMSAMSSWNTCKIKCRFHQHTSAYRTYIYRPSLLLLLLYNELRFIIQYMAVTLLIMCT